MSLLAGKRAPCGRAKDRPPIFGARKPSANCDQAASFPEALATWVAIASIKAGDRQS
jgi:hypothetical protein